MSVSVIIVNWNGQHLLEECLLSLRAQTCPADETIVVDNGSTDGSQAYIRDTYPWVTVIELGENKGFSVANNVAIRRATGEYIALLNNDLLLDPRWIERMTAALEEDRSLGSCACKMLFYQDRETIDSAGITVLASGNGSSRGMQEPDGPPFDESARVFGACAGAAVYRATMLHDIGLFDEDLYIYFEDVDLAFRAQLAGYDCLYVPEAVAYHHHSASSGRFGRKHYYLARNALLVVTKNMPSSLLREQLGRIVIGQCSFALTAAMNGSLGPYMRARIDALRLLPRMMKKRRSVQQRARRDASEIAARLS